MSGGVRLREEQSAFVDACVHGAATLLRAAATPAGGEHAAPWSTMAVAGTHEIAVPPGWCE
jgi:hypothetical protein